MWEFIVGACTVLNVWGFCTAHKEGSTLRAALYGIGAAYGVLFGVLELVKVVLS